MAESAMVTTVTLNAAMDRTLVVPNFQLGRRHRASEGVTLPGGRGVVIARALKRLGRPVIATGLAGGLNGANIVERLTAEGILNDFVRIVEPSRTSTAVIDPITGQHTEINEHGPRVNSDELDLLSEKLRYLSRASQCVVIAGSLPRDVPTDTYQRIVRQLHGKNVLAVVCTPDDTDALSLSLAAEPHLTIVEQREAEALVGHEVSSDDEFILALDEMGRRGGQYVVITTEHGCFARMRNRQMKSITYISAEHEPVEAVSELGSTDVFSAACVAQMIDDSAFVDCLTFGLAAALSNRGSLGAGVFDRGTVQKLQREIEIRELTPVPADVD